MWISEEERNQHKSQEKRWAEIRLRNKGNKGLPKKNRKRLRNKRKVRHEQFAATLDRTKKYLVNFWFKFSTAHTDRERLDLLKAAANPPWERVSGDMRRRCRRDTDHRMSLLFEVSGVEKCATCENRPTEKHHIVPCAFGGPSIAENLILICCACHDQIHPWMKDKSWE